MQHGRGTLICPQAVFTGNYVDGKKSFGVLQWGEKREYMYQGGFNNDLLHGKGTMKSPDGYFEGIFENNRKKGYGVFTWNNGSRYEGEYKDDLRNGFGEFFGTKGVSKFKGFWQHDKPYGLVKQQHDDPRKSHS